VPKMGVRDSAASMNSLVAIALFLSASTGTSTKERLNVLASKKVPPGGITGADMTWFYEKEEQVVGFLGWNDGLGWPRRREAGAVDIKVS
jgi:hypothetical protein